MSFTSRCLRSTLRQPRRRGWIKSINHQRWCWSLPRQTNRWHFQNRLHRQNRISKESKHRYSRFMPIDSQLESQKQNNFTIIWQTDLSYFRKQWGNKVNLCVQIGNQGSMLGKPRNQVNLDNIRTPSWELRSLRRPKSRDALRNKTSTYRLHALRSQQS